MLLKHDIYKRLIQDQISYFYLFLIVKFSKVLDAFLSSSQRIHAPSVLVWVFNSCLRWLCGSEHLLVPGDVEQGRDCTMVTTGASHSDHSRAGPGCYVWGKTQSSGDLYDSTITRHHSALTSDFLQNNILKWSSREARDINAFETVIHN